MTKREIMIEKLLIAECKRYEKLSDELIARVGAFLTCTYCPICFYILMTLKKGLKLKTLILTNLKGVNKWLQLNLYL